MSDSKYIVGIDLGTSNSILAYTPAEVDNGETAEINVLEIPQIIGMGSVGSRAMLPSFIFLPGEKDMSEDALKLPWKDDLKMAVGEFARERGAEIPQRLISSAKSWLCNPMVDRNQPVLPWGASAEVPKLSTVEASAAILDHIRRAWNFTMARNDESLSLERQDIYLTVPASFDAVARELTVKAAEMAHLPNITLLEEPQAAFYSWIEASHDRWRETIAPGDLVLVCDLGGGTSDFSLIRVSESAGELDLERIAVGGRYSVRGYRENLLLRDEGLIVSIESRIPLIRDKNWADVLQLVPFVDYGYAENSDLPTADPRYITSIGVGLQWEATFLSPHKVNPSFEIFWGIPLMDIETSEWMTAPNIDVIRRNKNTALQTNSFTLRLKQSRPKTAATKDEEGDS